MRRLSFDQHEFEQSESEESLELAISDPRQHPELKSFLTDCGASSQEGAVPSQGWPRWHTVVEHLRKFAGIELPHPTQCRTILVICDDWDDLELEVEAGPHLIWYHWFTTA